MSERTPIEILRHLFDVAVAACHPARVVPAALPPRPAGRIIVLGAGKASAAMAAAVESAWDAPLEGHVVTRYGHGAPTKWIEVIQAGHPLPDSAGAEAADRALARVQGLTADDAVLVLLSGGGSALWSAPIPPITLAEKQALTKALVLSGASIGDINCVRKHLSRIKGGRLAAAAHPARVVTLAISDVPHDDISIIASGPTVADSTTQHDATRILTNFGIETPTNVASVLNDRKFESIKPNDPRLAATSASVIARGADALQAVSKEARRLGFDVLVIGTDVEGDASEIARQQAAVVRGIERPAKPLLLLSGGELTVAVKGNGRGGPNRQYLLSLARAFDGRRNTWAIACDTDGIDGSDDTAGAWIAPDTIERARQLGLDPAGADRANDAGTFFDSLGQSVVTGPTRTNVNDFRAILVMPGN
jgi:hydroxypyruvate reductase